MSEVSSPPSRLYPIDLQRELRAAALAAVDEVHLAPHLLDAPGRVSREDLHLDRLGRLHEIAEQIREHLDERHPKPAARRAPTLHSRAPGQCPPLVLEMAVSLSYPPILS